ncbi:MAG: Gfo/Idh/MocA family protein [Phycisphaerales bacterium]
MSESNRSDATRSTGFDPLSGYLPSRRDFLGTAAGSLAAAAIAGVGAGAARASAGVRLDEPVGKAAKRAALKEGQTIRMAVVGTGGMGTGHCGAFAKLNKERGANVEVVALADPWPANMNRAHQKLTEEWQTGVEVTRHADYRELLKREDVHGVLIATPEHWHGQVARDAILAGKDVYCEKPMTLHLEDAVHLHRMVKANPEMILQVGTQKMALPSYREATKWVAEGLIGTPTVSQTSYCRNTPKGEWNYYHVDPNWKPGKDVDWDMWCGPLGKQAWDPYLLNRWRRYKLTSTGIIGDLLVHVLTPLMMAVNQGWPVKVTASGAHLIDKKMENHDTVNIIAEFETGHQMIVIGATNNDTGLVPMIRGPKGNIEVNDGSIRFSPQKPYAEEAESRKPQLANIGDDQDQHRMNWLQCIRTRQQPEANSESGLQVMVIVDLATRCLWEGGSWKFDPSTMKATRV